MMIKLFMKLFVHLTTWSSSLLIPPKQIQFTFNNYICTYMNRKVCIFKSESAIECQNDMGVAKTVGVVI